MSVLEWQNEKYVQVVVGLRQYLPINVAISYDSRDLKLEHYEYNTRTQVQNIPAL